MDRSFDFHKRKPKMKVEPGFLTGRKLYLREVRTADANEEYYNWLNDAEVSRFLETRYYPNSLERIRDFVQKRDGDPHEVFLAICHLDSHEHLGNIKLGPINWIHRSADISLVLGKKQFWGQGLATESIQLVTKYAFKKLNLHKLKAGFYKSNVGSQRAFQKVGFEEEGCLKKQLFSDGNYEDQVLMGFCRDAFEENVKATSNQDELT